MSSDANRSDRPSLPELLESLDANPLEMEDTAIRIAPEAPGWIHDALRGLHLQVQFVDDPDGPERVIELPEPDEGTSVKRLEHAIRTVFDPDALLFDLDGVLADVSASYRKAIRETAASFGVELDSEEIAEAKMQGDANNDWILTRRLIEQRGLSVELDEVVEVFEQFYHGTDDTPGFHEDEGLLEDPEWIADLAESFMLGIVTGRPRRDALRFLKHHNIAQTFDCVITMDDVDHVKPDPEPVLRCLNTLGTGHAWFFGDTPDDMEAATEAGLLALGVVPPGESKERTQATLREAGACRVLSSAREGSNLLP